jgi:hypothetical protein
MESNVRPDFVTLHDALVERVEVTDTQVQLHLNHFCLCRQETLLTDGVWSCAGRIVVDGSVIGPCAPIADDEIGDDDLFVDGRKTPWLHAREQLSGAIELQLTFFSGKTLKIEGTRVALHFTVGERFETYTHETTNGGALHHE